MFDLWPELLRAIHISIFRESIMLLRLPYCWVYSPAAALAAALCINCLFALPLAAEQKQLSASLEQFGIQASSQASRDHPSWRRPEQIHVVVPPAWMPVPADLFESLEAVSDGIPLVPVNMNINTRPMPNTWRTWKC
jgi:hypothetical protein